jgi:hypothetical protein
MFFDTPEFACHTIGVIQERYIRSTAIDMLLSGVETLPSQLWIYPPSGHL